MQFSSIYPYFLHLKICRNVLLSTAFSNTENNLFALRVINKVSKRYKTTAKPHFYSLDYVMWNCKIITEWCKVCILNQGTIPGVCREA